MYDAFSADYDRFVNWAGRLAAEMPFIERQLAAVGARCVLDAACGTGMHALALARRGYQVSGADLSAGMVERARANAAAAGVAARFEVAGFGELAQRVGTGFDALLCLGNSLPHALTPAELAAALSDFVACLRPGGLLLIQNRNFDAVLARRERWMEPQSHAEPDAEWLFFRFYDFMPDGTLAFNVVTLRRVGGGAWVQQVATTHLWPQRRAELEQALGAAGFGQVTCWGDLAGAPFDPAGSPNLILSALR
ncbi:MAG: class I SAM-dependent methyltransferase [Anaerolineae bacterium]|nr:class I SAM-dependent methyltransferase [Anaerolineae bacterium]